MFAAAVTQFCSCVPVQPLQRLLEQEAGAAQQGRNESSSACLLLPLLLPPPLLQAQPLSLAPAGATGLSGGESLCKLSPARRRRDLLDPGGERVWPPQREGREAEPGHHGWILCSWAPLPVSALGHSISSGEKPHLCLMCLLVSLG